MGVQDLYKEINDRSNKVHEIDYCDLKEKFGINSVAIDGYALLHASVSTCAMELCSGIVSTKFLSYCTKKLNSFIEQDIRVVLVLDGQSAPMKSDESKERHERRTKALNEFKKSSHLSKADQYKIAIKAAGVLPDMPKILTKWCKSNEIEVIRAPYEADPQMAALYHDKYVDAVVSEDSDLICYGVGHLIRNFVSSKNLQLITKEAIYSALFINEEHFARRYLLWYGMFLGQDYIKRIRSFGPKNCSKFMTALMRMQLDSVTSGKALAELLKKMSGRKFNEEKNQYFNLGFPNNIPETYLEDFINATSAFIFSLYYCPRDKKIKYLNDYRTLKSEDLYNLGCLPSKIDADYLLKVSGSLKTPEGYEDWKSYCEYTECDVIVKNSEVAAIETLPTNDKTKSSQSALDEPSDYVRAYTPVRSTVSNSKRNYENSNSKFFANLDDKLPKEKMRRD